MVSGCLSKHRDLLVSLSSIVDAITVMGKNMLHHLGETGDDEDEDGKHSNEREAPCFSEGTLSQLWKPHQCHSSRKYLSAQFCVWHSYSLLQAKVQILCDKALGRIKVSLALLWHIALNTVGKI